MLPFIIQKGISKNCNLSTKDHSKKLKKSTGVTNKFIDPNIKEIIQHRNNLSPYYSKKHAIRELN